MDWYSSNYWTMANQAAIIAGFAFTQLTTELPETAYQNFLVEVLYLGTTAIAMGMELSVLITTTFATIWAPGLALKGPKGNKAMNLAVENLKAVQNHVFSFFVVGILFFHTSNIFLLWCVFDTLTAVCGTVTLGLLGVAMVWYIASLTYRLRVEVSDAVEGRINVLGHLDNVEDIDEILEERRQGRGQQQQAARSSHETAPLLR